MANICTFEMLIKGTKENCYNMLNSDIPCYEVYVTDEAGNDDDYMLCLEGECRWTVTGSMVNVDDDCTLAAKAKRFNIELEVFGYDKSEPEWIEHYYYKGEQCLKEYNLPPFLMGYNFDEVDLSDEDRAKYTYREEHNVYILGEEFAEKFEWDEEEERMILPYEMSFEDFAAEH